MSEFKDDMKAKATEKLDAAKARTSEALETGKARADDALKAARAKTDEAIKATRAKADEAAKAARARTDDAIKVARAKADEAAALTRTSARKAATKTSEGIESNPLVALIGGLAIGAIAGALIPRSERETKTLGKTSRTLRDTATSAVNAAREVGKEQLDALGINSDAARQQVREIAKKIGEAASSAGAAAADTIRRK
jgi:ElaB/YqjD/DUF883 family membrane-anchored ribosome-binding protein